MAITYDTYVNQISNLTVIGSTTPEFQTMLPGMIDYSEQRIYRELNLLDTQGRDTSAVLTPNSRTINLSTNFGPGLGALIAIQDINVITPSSLTLASGGVRNQLNPAALQFVDYLYPGETAPSSPSVPSLFAMIDQNTIVVGPSPDAAYQVEVVGTFRPSPLSSANSSTFLTAYLPDLFIAASMVFASGYMRDFGQQADNPQMGSAWEAQYKQLLQSAIQEEIRKKYNTTYVSQLMPAPASGGPV